MAHVVNVGGP